MLCPCARRVRTGQLAVVGGYCADLRERCEVLTDAQGEMKERLRAARLREMALSTELESVAISNMHNMGELNALRDHHQPRPIDELLTGAATRRRHPEGLGQV